MYFLVRVVHTFLYVCSVSLTKRSKEKSYDYFDFVSNFQESETISNLKFCRALRDAGSITTDHHHLKAIDEAKTLLKVNTCLCLLI